jgi:hypothetical protein
VTLTLGGNDLLSVLGKGQPCEAGVADPQSPACQAAVQDALAAFPATYRGVLAKSGFRTLIDNWTTRSIDGRGSPARRSGCPV